MNKIKLIFRITVKIIKILFLLLERALKILPKYLNKAVEKIENKLRFSISFKITVTYVFTFVIIFFFITLGIIGSFNYYMQNGRKDNYIVVLLGILAVWNIMGLIIIIIIGSKASKKFLSPVYTMADTVKKISIDDLDKRLDIKGSKNELKDLAKTFNDMLDRIQSSVEKQNQFVSDASHELRTPISIIQGYANMLDRWGKDDKDVL